jgi:small subunit ribosomal protein S1
MRRRNAMRDKKDDDFFDEPGEEQAREGELMRLLDGYDKVSELRLEKGQKVGGTVSRVASDYVFVDIGGRSEGAIAARELADENGVVTVVPGQRIEAYVASAGPDELLLTTSSAGLAASTGDLTEVVKNAVPVQGKVTGINKGGLQVRVMQRNAFCPLSQIELRYVEDVSVYLGTTMPFVITRITDGGRNIVLSRIPLLEAELSAKLDRWAEGIEAGSVYRGRITRIAEYGLFVDMGGIEGLVHRSEVSWLRAGDLQESFAVGDEIDYVVLRIERAEPLRSTKVSLSMRHATGDPWKTVSERFSPGRQVSGTISRIARFGAFVQLSPEIEGLIPLSEMSWSRRVRRPEDVVSVGDSVNVAILSVDEVKREIACSLKDVGDDPWTTAADRFPPGSVVQATVASQSRYGYFIDLDEGVTGLLVHAKVPQEKKGSLSAGAAVQVSVESVDTENRRISLSLASAGQEVDEEAVREYLDNETTGSSPEGPASEFGEALRKALGRRPRETGGEQGGPA